MGYADFITSPSKYQNKIPVLRKVIITETFIIKKLSGKNVNEVFYFLEKQQPDNVPKYCMCLLSDPEKEKLAVV